MSNSHPDHLFLVFGCNWGMITVLELSDQMETDNISFKMECCHSHEKSGFEIQGKSGFLSVLIFMV